MNGVPLPVDAPSVAAVLHDAGYRTALIGKAALRAVPRSVRALHRERARAARHHAARWHPPRLRAPRVRDPRRRRARCTTRAGCGRAPRGGRRCSTRCSTATLQVNAAGGGDTGAPQVHVNPIPRDWYHTDWVADRTIAWLDSLDADDDWFCWMSFPDPHHPWDPPQSRGRPHRLARRAAARRLPRPTRPSARRILDAKPRHWRLWYDGTLVSNYEAPARLGAGDAHRRPGPRGQRPQRGRVRADRRGARPRAGARSTREAGTTTSTSSSPPTTASCRATSACCSRARTTSTR